jgi:hypothetical protein
MRLNLERAEWFCCLIGVLIHPPHVLFSWQCILSLSLFLYASFSTEALAAYNKQRLAYVLRSLHQQQDGPDSGAPAAIGSGAGSQQPQRQEIDAYLEEALHDPRVDAAAKREILSKCISFTIFAASVRISDDKALLRHPVYA